MGTPQGPSSPAARLETPLGMEEKHLLAQLGDEMCSPSAEAGNTGELWRGWILPVPSVPDEGAGWWHRVPGTPHTRLTRSQGGWAAPHPSSPLPGIAQPSSGAWGAQPEPPPHLQLLPDSNLHCFHSGKLFICSETFKDIKYISGV